MNKRLVIVILFVITGVVATIFITGRKSCTKELVAKNSSDKKSQQLVTEEYVAEAKKWLGYARNGKMYNCPDCGKFRDYKIRDYLKKAGDLPLSTIGTTEKELNALMVEGITSP